MKPAEKKKLLIVNGLYWAAAMLVPPLLKLIPVSHPPKILPLFIFMFMLALAICSTYMWSKALKTTTAE